MSFMDSIKIALSSIMAHKLRSALTMLGIIIGVGSIITVVAIGQGGEAALKSQIVGDGNNTIQLMFEPEGSDDPFAMIEYVQPTFTQENLMQIKDIPEVKHVITVNQNMTELPIDEEQLSSVDVLGITKEYFAVNKVEITEGRNLDDGDFSQSDNVVVVSQRTVDEAFQGESPVGEIIEVSGIPFRVVGVYQSNDEFLGFGMPQMLMPLSLWPVLYGTDEIQSVTIQAVDADSMKTAGQKAADLLNSTKSDELKGEYTVLNMEDLEKEISQLTGIMTSIIGGIAGISLLVGGIGVMNIMLVSVTERTREIGIRKALGATRGKILLQFLIEAMMLTVLGGVIGIGLGVGGAHIVSIFAKWPPLVSWQVVVGGVLFSMTLGIIFGLIPANKAAKLDPIDALRYE